MVEVGLALVSLLLMFWYFKPNKKPTVATNWPILGRLPSILRSTDCVNEVITDVCCALGVFFKVRDPKFTQLDYLVTCQPKNMEYILKTNFSNFPKGQAFVKMLDIFGDAIFTMDSDSWVAQRKMLHTRFSSKDFRSFITNVNRSELELALLPLLLHVAKDSSVVDLQDVFLRMTHDTGFTMIFGRNPNLSSSFSEGEFAEAIDVAVETILFRHLVPSTWWKLLRLVIVGQERKYSKEWVTIDET
ncbi:hypothetical protein GIB67_019380 [Kingdonia uniflora]|uniref:Cytochrome P450 n=1 Tax=Kingdonia uniflora TaxID=39325 RepID=A0A7J7M1P9_9MAGN|nr:hypothetical protein GIB67_019380 [Kingdonia uniflora]